MDFFLAGLLKAQALIKFSGAGVFGQHPENQLAESRSCRLVDEVTHRTDAERRLGVVKSQRSTGDPVAYTAESSQDSRVGGDSLGFDRYRR